MSGEAHGAFPYLYCWSSMYTPEILIHWKTKPSGQWALRTKECHPHPPPPPSTPPHPHPHPHPPALPTPTHPNPHPTHQPPHHPSHPTTLPPGQDDIFKHIFLNENVRIPIQISLKFVPKGPIGNKPALVQVLTWRRTGAKPFPELMLTQFTDAYMRH